MVHEYGEIRPFANDMMTKPKPNNKLVDVITRSKHGQNTVKTHGKNTVKTRLKQRVYAYLKTSFKDKLSTFVYNCLFCNTKYFVYDFERFA